MTGVWKSALVATPAVVAAFVLPLPGFASGGNVPQLDGHVKQAVSFPIELPINVPLATGDDPSDADTNVFHVDISPSSFPCDFSRVRINGRSLNQVVFRDRSAGRGPIEVSASHEVYAKWSFECVEQDYPSSIQRLTLDVLQSDGEEVSRRTGFTVDLVQSSNPAVISHESWGWDNGDDMKRPSTAGDPDDIIRQLHELGCMNYQKYQIDRRMHDKEDELRGRDHNSCHQGAECDSNTCGFTSFFSRIKAAIHHAFGHEPRAQMSSFYYITGGYGGDFRLHGLMMDLSACRMPELHLSPVSITAPDAFREPNDSRRKSRHRKHHDEMAELQRLGQPEHVLAGEEANAREVEESILEIMATSRSGNLDQPEPDLPVINDVQPPRPLREIASVPVDGNARLEQAQNQQHGFPVRKLVEAGLLFIIFAAVFVFIHRRAAKRSGSCLERRKKCAEKREERRRRRDYRRAARKEACRNFWVSVVRRVRGDGETERDEKSANQELADAEKEVVICHPVAADLDADVTDEIRQLRNAAGVVSAMLAAEEGRMPVLQPAANRSVDTLPLYRSRPNSLRSEDLPYYELYGGSDGSSVRTGDTRYTPSTSDYAPTDSERGSLDGARDTKH